MGATHAGDIKDLCAIAPPDIGVLTAISPVHLDSFGTLEGLAAAKGELPSPYLSLVRWSPRLARQGRRRGRAGNWTGAPSPAPVKQISSRPGSKAEEGLRFVASMAGESAEVRSPVFGTHLVEPLLAALGGALALGLGLEQAARGLSACGERDFGATSTGSKKTSPSTMTPTTHPLPPSRQYSGTVRIRHVDNVEARRRARRNVRAGGLRPRLP